MSFVDGNSKPSKLGCKTLAMHSSMLGHMNITTRLEVLPMELLMACDKAEVMDALRKIPTSLMSLIFLTSKALNQSYNK